jgi:hypothetical protein
MFHQLVAEVQLEMFASHPVPVIQLRSGRQTLTASEIVLYSKG